MVERRRTDITVGQPEIRAVQDVKQLRAELQLFRFGHLEIFKRCEVPVGLTPADIHVAPPGATLPRVEKLVTEKLVTKSW
jgi:hypothetical protein